MKKLFFKALVMSLIMTFQLSFAQKSVSGTVTDSSGLPLPGATVLVVGTSNGVSTDFDGVYSITASEGDILSFSYVGFKTQNLTVGSSNTMNVSLSTDSELDEVVVTALGIEENKLKLSYSTQQLSESEINISQTTNIRDAIAGKVAGIQGAFQAGSKLGQQGTLYLRGAISLKGRSTWRSPATSCLVNTKAIIEKKG